MKKIILVLLFTTSLISCTQNEGANTPGDSTVLILGKWNLVSDTYGNDSLFDEMLTTCQQGFWQFDFKNNKEIVFRTTSDDPSLGLTQCNPKLLAYTYTINNDLLMMTPVNSGYSETGWYIQSVSSTTLVLKSGVDNNRKFRNTDLRNFKN